MTKNNNINQTEQGRSMVEMLGVLAIIGVLSIGGIAGYTMAMNKHRANELLDGGSKRAMVAMQQIALGYDAKDVSFAEFTGEDGFTGSPVAIQGGELGIHVNGVKQAVCETLVNMVDGENVYVAVEEGEDTVAEIDADECTDPIDLLLVYKMGQSAGTGGGDDDDDDTPSDLCASVTCPSGQACVAGECDSLSNVYKTVSGGTHEYLESTPPDCGEGWHWATVGKFLTDYGCTDQGDGYYSCSTSFDFYGWLVECTNGGLTIADCDSTDSAFTANYGLVNGFTRDYYYYAVCRRD